MAVKIYTKKGDKGTTALIGGLRVPKNNIRIESYGTVDELNAYIGWLITSIGDQGTKDFLLHIQQQLFIIGSLLACNPQKDIPDYIPNLQTQEITLLENHIDRMNAALPSMTHFILPGGSQAVSLAHVARCVCRRAERICVQLQEAENILLENNILPYLNRLSDYLFVVARYIGKLENVAEVKWMP